MSGFNVFPAEVEEVLLELDGVRECAVVGVPHPHTGEAVKAFVVVEPGYSLEEDAVIEYAARHLARYKCPQKVNFVDELPAEPQRQGPPPGPALTAGPSRPGAACARLRAHVNERTSVRAGMSDRVRHIPEATVARLPVYLRSLAELVDEKIATVSSERLAEMAGVNAAKVRKDLSYLGSYGTRGVGYDVEYLLFQMSRELGLTHDWPVVIVGAGNLGQRPRQLRRVHPAGLPRRRADRRRPVEGGRA